MSVVATLATAFDCLAAGPALTVTSEPAPEPVFRSRVDGCAPNDIPDAPARAFRDSSGAVHLIAGHDVNRALVGAALRAVKIACDVVFEGRHADDPQQFDDRVWLAAFYTEDGRKIAALAHEEFHAYLRPQLCPSRQYRSCWVNAVIGVESDDGGRHFERKSTPVPVVAALPYPYEPDIGRQVGYFSPSNILTDGDYHYVFVFAEPYRAQERGPCLLRTRTPFDPTSWRAWDGHDFSVRLGGARQAGSREAAAVCKPIAGLQSTITTVVRHQPSGLFVALFAASRAAGPAGRQTPGVYYATSRDLLAWSDPALLLELPIMFAYTCGVPAVYAYPSLIDESAATRNFDTVGDRAYLYATRFNMTDCKLPMDRDLVRFPVKLAGAAAR